METSEYETNAFLINGITSIAFQIYEPSPEQSQPFTPIAPDFEALLQDGKYILHYDATRRALWHFYMPGKGFAAPDGADGRGSRDTTRERLGAALEVGDTKLTLVEEGSFEPIHLFKGRVFGPRSANTPLSSSSPNAAALDASLRPPASANSAAPASADPDSKRVTALVSATPDVKTSSITVKEAHEHFITAMLSTISAGFCRHVGAIPLSHRTVLLKSKVTGQEQFSNDTREWQSPVVGTFRVYLTTTGSLLTSLSLSLAEGLLPMNEVPITGQAPLATQVLAAPFGVLGKYQGLASTFNFPEALGQTPDNRLLRLKGDSADTKPWQWREACTRMLCSRGLSQEALQNCTWIALQLFRRKHGDQKNDGKTTPLSGTSTTISWPSMLCFRKKTVLPAGIGSELGLGSPSNGELGDSLLDAKAWVNSGAEREENITQRQKEREAAAPRDVQATPSATQQPNAHSPLDPRRAANAAAASAMYPTPPDAVQNPAVVTPAPPTEGNTSSPGAPPSTVAPVDVDITMENAGTGAVQESGQETWEAQEPKRDRGDSFLEEDNLFGDVGSDMFGDTHITDADFNFFDEEPENEGLGLSDLPDIAMSDVTKATIASGPPQHNDTHKGPRDTAEAPSETKKPGPDEAPPTFAKPELRHARSSLNNDETKPRSKPLSNNNPPSSMPAIDTSISTKPGGGIKRELSPFDPDTVFKKVRASIALSDPTPTSLNTGSPTRKGSIFDGVKFNPELPLANKKYEAGGRFGCQWAAVAQPESPTSPGKPPTTDYLRRHGKPLRKQSKHDQTSTLIQTITGHLENSTLQGSPEDLEDIASDADDASIESMRIDSPDPSDEPSSPFKASTKRLNLDDEIASHATSARDVESIVDESDPTLALELPRMAKLEAPEVAVVRYFEDPEPLSTQLSLTDDDAITVAQILTEQAISGNLNLRDQQFSTFDHKVSTETRRQLAILARGAYEALQDTLPRALGDVSRCYFRSMIEVADVPLLGPPSRFQPRAVPSRDPNAEPPKPNNLYQIPPPHMEVKRLDSKLSVLPSTIAFWDTIGLSPSLGAKNVIAACVYPDSHGMAEFAGTFLERMRNTYEFLKLGSFEGLPGNDVDSLDGLVPWDLTSTMLMPTTMTLPPESGTLRDRLEDLNQRMIAADASEENFVIFFAYVPSRPETILEACASFQQLFEMHKKLLSEKRKAPENELVLQLVPTDYLTIVSGMPTSTPDDLMRLAFETYDRCTLFEGPMPAPAIALEQSIPRTIDFRLNHTSSSSLMNENTCIHIAYAQSVDERWITAAWTDNRGCQQMTASYNLARKGKLPSRSFTDVANEIWETTHDLICRWKVHWRVMITKCGPMDQSEIDFWIALAQTESQANISLTLITVDTDPSLQLVPSAVKIPVSAPAAFGYTTPVSTPQPQTLSPEQSGTPTTPVKESAEGSGGNEPAEGDAILVDFTDQTWGAILSHRLGNSSTLGDLSSTLVSGYLVKRGGTEAEDPPVVMEVGIIHSDGNPRAHETLLREMLSYFRGLGTLARARGVVDRETDVRPWHVAAAEKGVRALYLLM